MIDKINRALLKLSDKQRKKLMQAFALAASGQLEGLDVKKLKVHTDLFRLRVGDSRLVYQRVNSSKLAVIYIGRRNDKTYRDF